MPKLTITVGLPGCGKTTWANQQVRSSKKKTININRDMIRLDTCSSVHDYRYSKANEKYTTSVQIDKAKHAFENGWDIIVSDTNLSREVQNMWKERAKQHGYHFVVKDFFKEHCENGEYVHDYFALKSFVTLCKERNLKRMDSVPESVIDTMVEKYYLSDMKVDTNVFDPTLKYCIIVDIDGTLAHMNDRNPYDEKNVHHDTPDHVVIDSVLADVMYYKSKGIELEVRIMSGRHDVCYSLTEMWLTDNNVPYSQIHMRKADDNRPDDIVKYELYREHIHNKFNVVKVYDDRDKVVKMWRELLGLKVFAVAPGNF